MSLEVLFTACPGRMGLHSHRMQQVSTGVEVGWNIYGSLPRKQWCLKVKSITPVKSENSGTSLRMEQRELRKCWPGQATSSAGNHVSLRHVHDNSDAT